MKNRMLPVSPSEMLVEEFLTPLGMSKYKLAKLIGVPATRIGDIVAGKRAITADKDLRLCRLFGLSDGWWLRLQASYDTAVARKVLAKKLERFRRHDACHCWQHFLIAARAILNEFLYSTLKGSIFSVALFFSTLIS